jgi:hypothetical protein
MTDIELHDISVSSTGIRYSYQSTDQTHQFHINAILKDGTEVRTSGGSGSLSADGKTWMDSYTWLFLLLWKNWKASVFIRHKYQSTEISENLLCLLSYHIRKTLIDSDFLSGPTPFVGSRPALFCLHPKYLPDDTYIRMV